MVPPIGRRFGLRGAHPGRHRRPLGLPAGVLMRPRSSTVICSPERLLPVIPPALNRKPSGPAAKGRSDRRDDPGQIAQPGHLRRAEQRSARAAQHDRGVGVTQWRGGQRGVHVPPDLRHPIGAAVQRLGVGSGSHGAEVAWVSGAPGLPTMRCSPAAEMRATVHQPTRSTRGASSASTCSRAARSAAAAMWSMSSSSRCASNRPVCGRMVSTRTLQPFGGGDQHVGHRALGQDDDQVVDGVARPRSTTSSDGMSAPTEPRATASDPRLPGRSSSWTRSR